MIHVGIKDGKVLVCVDDHKQTEAHPDCSFQSRHDWKTKEQVDQLAAQMTAELGTLYIGTDAGEYVWPRFDIIEAPKVGDVTSMAFNGDYYPCGKIDSISKTLRVITTTDGKKFYRRRESAVWIYSRTWTLVPGVHTAKNPHF